MFKGDRNFAVGLFVSVAIAVFVLFVIWLTGRSGAEEMTRYTLMFDRDVSGLAVGGPVKYMGMNIGSVVHMDLDTAEAIAAFPEEGLADPRERFFDQIVDEALLRAVDELPEAFRQAVWLRDVEEFSYADIAAIVDVPIGTVMSRISRGRRMLYERLAPIRGGAAFRVASR